MTASVISLVDAFAAARQRGYTHVMVVQDRGTVPHYARVEAWQAVAVERASGGSMVALYDLSDAGAPRICHDPRVLRDMTPAFAAALAAIAPLPERQAGLAVIVARPQAGLKG